MFKVKNLSVTLLQSMGDDEFVADAARVSTKRDGKGLGVVGLLRYLASEGHTSPFEHVVATVLVEAPLFVRDQWVRHRTQSYSIQSFRYTTVGKDVYLTDEEILDEYFYIPPPERPLYNSGTAARPKFETRPLEDKYVFASTAISESSLDAIKKYRVLIDEGVASEVARNVLPANTMTRFYATANLKNWADFVFERTDEGAQWEIKMLAHQLYDILMDIAPVAWEQLTRSRPTYDNPPLTYDPPIVSEKMEALGLRDEDLREAGRVFQFMRNDWLNYIGEGPYYEGVYLGGTPTHDKAVFEWLEILCPGGVERTNSFESYGKKVTKNKESYGAFVDTNTGSLYVYSGGVAVKVGVTDWILWDYNGLFVVLGNSSLYHLFELVDENISVSERGKKYKKTLDHPDTGDVFLFRKPEQDIFTADPYPAMYMNTTTPNAMYHILKWIASHTEKYKLYYAINGDTELPTDIVLSEDVIHHHRSPKWDDDGTGFAIIGKKLTDALFDPEQNIADVLKHVNRMYIKDRDADKGVTLYDNEWLLWNGESFVNYTTEDLSNTYILEDVRSPLT